MSRRPRGSVGLTTGTARHVARCRGVAGAPSRCLSRSLDTLGVVARDVLVVALRTLVFGAFIFLTVVSAVRWSFGM
jgi:hypothetical protein